VLLLPRSRRAPGSRGHRIAIVLRWPFGLIRVTWQYLWRSTPVHRVETDGDVTDLPPPCPPELMDHEVQAVEDGVGPLLHRRYRVVVDGARTSPEALMAEFAGRPNRAAPGDVAVFEKTRGRPGVLAVGDEFLIRMPGPWDGPVRVIAQSSTGFRLATLRGHLEAGQIEFRACRGDDGALRFEIESRARPGDRLSHLLYNRLRLAKEIQLNLWVETCLRMAGRAGGRPRDGVHVHTRRVPEPLPRP
jgi:hypothetical protein